MAGDIKTIAETVSVLASSTTGSQVSRQGEIPFRIFPNPATDNIYICCSRDKTITEIKILDMNGNLVKQFTPANPDNNNMLTYDCREIPGGGYIIK